MGRNRHRENPPPRCSPRFGGGKLLSRLDAASKKRHLESPPPRFGGDKLRRLYDGMVKKPDRTGLLLNADEEVQKGDLLLLNADEAQKVDGGEHNMLPNADEVQKGDGGQSNMLLNDGGEQDLLLLNADEVQKGDGGGLDLVLNASELQKGGDGGERDLLLTADEVQKGGDGGEPNMLLLNADEVQKGGDGGKPNDLLLLTADELKNKPTLSKAERMRLLDLTYYELLDKPKSEWTDKELLLRCPQYTQCKINEEDGLKEMPKLRQYLKQLRESEGFDITGPVPRITTTQCRIYPLQLTEKKHQKYVNDLARLAIESYNDTNQDFPVKTNFQVVDVKNATRNSFHWSTYYITFTAKDKSPRKLYKSPKTFQAKVAVPPPCLPNANGPVVDFCRLKAKS